MVTKLAALILAGSLVTLSVAGIAGLSDHSFGDWSDLEDHVRVERRIQIKHRIEEARNEVEVARQEVAEARSEYAETAGAYVFDASGNPAGKLPWNAHIDLDLRPGGRYALKVRTKVDQDMQEETSWGHYRVSEDRVILYSAHDDDRHEFRRDGDRLVFDASWAKKLALEAIGVDDTFMTRVHE